MALPPVLAFLAVLALATPGAGASAEPTGPLPAHPNSWSRSLIVVTDEGVHHFVRVQVLSLLEVVPAADPDKNRLVEAGELDSVSDDVAAYLAEHYVLGPPGGPAWPAELRSLELISNDGDAVSFEQLVDVERFFAVSPPPELAVEMTLFLDESPRHFDLLDVRWPDGSDHETRLWAAHTSETFVAPAADAGPPTSSSSSVLQDLWLGAEHILDGIDHIAFLLALLVASRSLRSLVAVVTAFTLAHSVTLTLAAMDVVRLPARPVELVIAASIAYVGLVNLIRKGQRPLWIEAFVFGLIHGLGFASALARLLPTGEGRLATLVVFNVGIELGQLAIVLAALGLLALARRWLPGAPAAGPTPAAGPALAPAAVRTWVSVAVLVAGCWWLVLRAIA